MLVVRSAGKLQGIVAEEVRRDSVAQEVKSLLKPAKPRPWLISSAGTESGLQALSSYFLRTLLLPEFQLRTIPDYDPTFLSSFSSLATRLFGLYCVIVG